MNRLGGCWCIVALAALLFAAANPTGVAAEEDLCAYGSGDAAIAACTRQIESGRFKGHALAVRYSNRGIEWRIKNDYARAFADYGEAIRIDPKYADAYYNRCVAHNRKEGWDLALADCNKAIALGPTANALNATGQEKLSNERSKSDYFTQRGIAYLGKQEIDRAIADFGEALRLYPRNVAALNNRARAWQAKGDTARANEDLEMAKQLAK
jgi:tetratricopeptide (TPR) repeat protein